MEITLSVVVPVYSGEAYLEELMDRIAGLREKWAADAAPIVLSEVIFVDDELKDSSGELLAKLTTQYDWIRVVKLSRNFGQHAATVAGICHSATDWVVTLDEDLQHRPEEINTLLKAAVDQNADVVYAQPRVPVHGKTWRDSNSRWVKSILARISAIPQIKIFNSFRLVRGTVARAAASSSSSQTYLDIAISWFTNSCISVKVDMRDDRFMVNKKSGYTLKKLIRHAKHLTISSNVRIASIGILVGTVAVIIAIVFGSMVVVQKIFFPDLIKEVGWASLATIVSLFGGVIIILLCIVLEYTSVILVNQLGKPTFFTIDRSKDGILKTWYEAKVKLSGHSST